MTTSIDPDATLARIVTEHPGAARRFERLGFDYCCGGRQTLADACAARDLDVASVTAALADVDGAAEPEAWATLGPVDLVGHIEATHHRYLHDELPRLAALAGKVQAAHGSRHPELAEVRALVGELRLDLEPHLAKEERILFPAIRVLFNGSPGQVPGGTLRMPISVMLAEHDATAVLLDRLRRTTGDYVPPPDACTSFRALYDGLAELEADTHLHVHKENNLLFPAVAAREDELTGA
jgi:regulator of cell morphogenesis and NO signaling